MVPVWQQRGMHSAFRNLNFRYSRPGNQVAFEYVYRCRERDWPREVKPDAFRGEQYFVATSLESGRDTGLRNVNYIVVKVDREFFRNLAKLPKPGPRFGIGNQHVRDPAVSASKTRSRTVSE